MDKAVLNAQAISPLDGRYYAQVKELSQYFSEFTLFQKRLFVEIQYLLFLVSEDIVSKKISVHDLNLLTKIVQNFNKEDFEKIKSFENSTKHDVKSLEYFLRDKLGLTSVSSLVNFIHLGLTSEDVNNLAFGLITTDFISQEYLPILTALVENTKTLAVSYRHHFMVGRTHGQVAVPTTLGKELAVYASRFDKLAGKISSFKLEGKLNGAVGNFNALSFVYPKIDWPKKAKKFVESLGLKNNPLTTQRESGDSFSELFDHLKRLNLVSIGLCQDIWMYASFGYLALKKVEKQVGSSTMPQKVNPIDFEAAEGNLQLANSLFSFFSQKLVTSRLQRDLSDSTVKRNFGVAFGHTILAMKMILKGLAKISPNREKMLSDLEADWSILAEAIQVLLKSKGYDRSFELVKNLTRGRKITKKQYEIMVRKLPVDKAIKTQLQKLTPANYVGLAVKLVDLI